MDYTIRVIPKARRLKVEETGNKQLKVHLTQPACEGKANIQLIEVLADYLRVKKYQIRIVQGVSSRNKKVHIGTFSR